MHYEYRPLLYASIALLAVSIAMLPKVSTALLSYLGISLSMSVLCIAAIAALTAEKSPWRIVVASYTPVTEMGSQGEIAIDVESAALTLLKVQSAEVLGDYGFKTRLIHVQRISMVSTKLIFAFFSRLGMHIATNIRLVLTDPLNTLRIHIIAPITPIIIRVSPIISTALATHASPSMRLLGVAASRKRGSGTMVYSVREYVPGDDYRRIEWKATARTGKLMVREYEHETLRGIILALSLHDGFFEGDPSAYELLTPILIRLATSIASAGMWLRVAIVTERGFSISEKITKHSLRELARCFSSVEWPQIPVTYPSSNRVLKHMVRIAVEESCREPCTIITVLDPVEGIDITMLNDLLGILARGRHVLRALLVSPRIVRFAAGALPLAELYALKAEVARLRNAAKALPRICIPLIGASLQEVSNSVEHTIDIVPIR